MAFCFPFRTDSKTTRWIGGRLEDWKLRSVPFASLLLLLTSVFILAGCGEDEILSRPMLHLLEIKGLSSTNQTLNAGDTATVTVQVNYSGDEGDLTYTWKATGGRIFGEGPSATYLAPDAAGTDTITLEVTDGNVSDLRAITVEVVAHLLQIDSGAYWEGKNLTPALKYQVDITKIFRPNPILRYEILQEESTAGAFLSIHINDDALIEDVAIGEVQLRNRVPPDTSAQKPLITGSIDTSGVIRAPGRYEVTLTLVVSKAVERGWLLRNIQLVGVEGSALRL